MNKPSDRILKCYQVRGHVQGVCFRASTADKARTLNLTGWVRNLPDGSVQTLVCGPPAQLRTFKAWLHLGPSTATVESVEENDVQAHEKPTSAFEIRRS